LRKDGLAEFLRSADFGIVSSVACADDLCAGRLQRRQLLFLIVHTVDDFDAAVDQIELLRSRYPHGRVAVVADRYRLNELAAAFRAGAHAYFIDVTSCDIFIKSLELVMMGELVFPPAFLPFALDAEGEHRDHADTRDGHNGATARPEDRIAPQLSPRENSILRCLIEGDSNKRIARKVNITEATVKVHIKAILRKIGVHNRTQAAIWGMNSGCFERSEHANSLPLAPNLTKRIAHPVEVMAEIKRTDVTLLPNMIEDEASHFEVPRLNGLINRDVRLRK
jgi:two-component system nitrate/nitrite response regulator NarL